MNQIRTANRPNPTKYTGGATRYCWNTDTRTHAANDDDGGDNGDRQTLARPVRLSVVGRSVG